MYVRRRRTTTTAMTTARQHAKRWRRPMAVGGRSAGAARVRQRSVFIGGGDGGGGGTTATVLLTPMATTTRARSPKHDAHRLDQLPRRRRRRWQPLPVHSSTPRRSLCSTAAVRRTETIPFRWTLLSWYYLVDTNYKRTDVFGWLEIMHYRGGLSMKYIFF